MLASASRREQKISLSELRAVIGSLDRTEKIVMLSAAILDERDACCDVMRLADLLVVLSEFLPARDRLAVGHRLQQHASELVTLLN